MVTRAYLRYAREGQNVTQAGPKCHTSRAKMSHKGQNVTQSCYNVPDCSMQMKLTLFGSSHIGHHRENTILSRSLFKCPHSTLYIVVWIHPVLINKWHACISITNPGSKVHGANMGPIWGRQDPGGSPVGPMNFAIWEVFIVWGTVTKVGPHYK